MTQTSSHASHRRRWWAPLAARPLTLALAAMVVLLVLVSPHWKADPDSGGYLSLARSFASGHGLRRYGLRQWYYAPLYSVWIAPSFWLGRRPFLAVSVINVLTAWALVLGTYAWFGRYSRRGAGFVAALVGINVGLWDVVREPRSETLFSALLIWAAVFLARAADDRGRFAVDVVVGAMLVTASCLTRQVGIFLTAGFTVAMAVRWARGRATAGRVSAAIVVGLAATAAVGALVVHDRWAGRLDRGAHAVSYVDQYRQADASVAAQLLDGVRRQTADVGRLLLPGLWGSFAHQGQWLNVNTILYVAFTVPVAIGWWRLTRRTADPLLWTVPFYGAMFVVWPFDQGTRFNVPMLPVLWAAAWTMLARWPRRRPAIFAVVLVLHLGASAAYLAHDAAAVGRLNRTFAPLTSLAAKIDTPEPVATLDLSSNQPRFVTYQLDRNVRVLARRDPVPAETRWLVLPPPAAGAAGRPVVLPDGFAVVAEAEGYRLCRRSR